MYMCIQVYDAKDGSHLDTLRGHRETVYTLSYSRDGQWKYTIASGLPVYPLVIPLLYKLTT